MGDLSLEELVEDLIAIHESTRPAPSDEGMDNLVEAAIDLLWPKASRTLRGDGWILARETND